MLRHRFVAALLAATLALPAAAAEAGTKSWKESFDVGTRPEVRVRTADGRIRVHPGPAGKVEALVRWDAKHWGFTSPPREPEVSMTKDGNTIEVTVREPSVVVAIGGVSEALSVDVMVPAASDLVLRTSDGSVTIERAIAGLVDVTTGDGRMTLRGTRGEVRLTTRDGTIDATGLDGIVVVDSKDGRTGLEGRFDQVHITAKDGPVELTARRGSRLREGWRLETEDGRLTTRIPKDLRADLDARTEDGRIRFELPVHAGARDPHVIRGRLNGGGPPLVLRTKDGTLTIAVSEDETTR